VSPRLLAAAALLLLLPAFFLRPPSRQQELRVLISARGMLEDGNWLHPRFQDQSRFRKPPLAYWMAAPGLALGGERAAWAGRLLFLLCSIACLELLRRSASPEAALLFLLSLGMLRYGAGAESDFPQLLGALFCIHAAQRKQGWLCGFGLAWAVLAKGPAVPAILLPTLLLGLRPLPPWSFWLKLITVPLGAAAFWLLRLFADPVAREALQRELSATIVDSAHPGSPAYYLYTLPLMLLPGLLLLRPRKQPFPRLPLAWLGSGMLLLSLISSKQQHYSLLLIPPACWLLAPMLRPWVQKAQILLPSCLILGLGLGLGEALSTEGKDAAFLRRLHPQLPPNTLHVVGINSAIFDFHLGRHVHNIDSAQRALQRAQPGDAVIVLQKPKYFDAPEPSAEQSADDAERIRRFYPSF